MMPIEAGMPTKATRQMDRFASRLNSGEESSTALADRDGIVAVVTIELNPAGSVIQA